MNELCKLKGYMWFFSKRKDVQKKDGLYSMATEKCCARCGITKKVN